MSPSFRPSLLCTSLALASLAGACRSTPAPTASTPIEVGTSFTLESEVLGQQRIINVCLPWGYAERDERFPVVYLIDGGARQDLLPIAGFAALASLSGQFREFILIGVQTDERRFELTTPSEVAEDLQAIPHNGGAADFRRFIVDEVQPWVEARYRTSGERAVLGESLAGFFIVDTFLRSPESFEHYIAVSPSLWWNERALALSADERLTSGRFPAGRSLYLTVADETAIQAGLEPLLAALEAHAPEGLTWWFEPLPDEHHHTLYNPATLDALRRVFAPAAPE